MFPIMNGISMTCYFRHKQMKEVFEEVCVEVTKENKKDLDKVIHGILGVEYKNCPATWKAVKAHLAEDRASFVQQLKAAV